LTLRAVAAAHRVTLARGAARRGDGPAAGPEDPEADLQPSLDVLASGVSEATTLIASALRELGTSPADPGGPALPPLPKLRPMAQALRARSGGGGWDEREGLFTAADSLVDAINAAAHVLRRRASND
jgi:hypothetical protein